MSWSHLGIASDLSIESFLTGLRRAGVVKPLLEYEKAHTFPASRPFFEQLEPKEALGSLPNLTAPFWTYIHIPFCHYACNFCFYKKVLSSSIERLFPALLKGLALEVDFVRKLRQGEQVEIHDLYIGGGTPTALSPAQLSQILDLVEASHVRSSDFLGSCEASPESVEADKIRLLLARSITRISLGAQSLEQARLDRSRREHRVEEIFGAYEILRNTGCDHINVDLIYGFPGQTVAEWEQELKYALDRFRPESLTLYYLRYVPGTPLAQAAKSSERVPWPDLIEMRQVYFDLLRDKGYEMCRPHHFRLPLERVRRYRGAPTLDHGNRGRQIGFGPSAFSHVGDFVSRSGWPIRNWLRCVEERGFGTVEGRCLTQEDRVTRLAVKSLTGSLELNRTYFEEETGLRLDDVFAGQLQSLVGLGLLAESTGGFSLTELGVLLDEEIAYFLYPSGLAKC